MSIGGIYEILNTVNGKRYIGQTSGFGRRFIYHRYELTHNIHHSRHLQAAWNKYGATVFIFRPIAMCVKESLNSREQYCIDTLKPEYNIALDVIAPMRGRTTSAETRAKQSLVKIGKFVSDETRAKIGAASRARSPESNAKISAAAKGRVISAETRAKISTANRGKIRGPQSPEHIAKLSAARRGHGHPHTEESKKKIGASNSGKIRSVEFCIANAKAQTGKILSADTRDKISKSLLGNTRTKGRKLSPEHIFAMRAGHAAYYASKQV